MLVLLSDPAVSEHTEPPGQGYVWVATPAQYSEQQLPLDGIHYDWWRCTVAAGCSDGPSSRPYGTTRSMECEIPGGAGRVGLGHCGVLLGGSEDMCPPGDFGDCYGEHSEADGWSQVLGPHNPNPGQYDSRLCVAADNQEDVGALSPPTPGHYDCWPVPGTWEYRASCGGKVLAERGREHCGHWRAPTTPTTTTPTPTTTTPTPTTTTTTTTTTPPTTQECSRSGFVWFSEYGGCRPADCSAIGGGYVRNPDDGWCEPAPPPGDVLNSCVANFDILFPNLAWRPSFDEPHERRQYCSRRRLNYAPVWVTDHDGDPQRAGTTQTVAHRVLHVTGASPVLNPPFAGFDWNPDNRCDGADELNVHPGVDYDCLQVSVTVRAGFAGVDHSRSYFRAGACANPVGWAQTAERVCDSAAGAWYGAARSDDPGEWTVTVGDLARAGTSDHLVSVPFVVDVADWGEADWLHITAVASDYWESATGSTSRDTLTFRVARREGPPPSSDVIEVNVAQVADLPYRTGGRWVSGGYVPNVEDERFVEIARSKLLANDACPADLDCSDPAQWPVSIPAAEAQRCTSWAFKARPASRMLPTGQGLVGCDDLNDATNAGVRYWPQLWASGTDTFTYETPGGTATVAVRFTDAPPAVQQLVASDVGTALDVAVFGAPSEWSRRECKVWNHYYNTCHIAYGYSYFYYVTYTRDPAAGFSARHYSTAVPLDTIRDGDPDGDAASVEITDAHNPHLHGNAATVTSARFSHWRLGDTAEATVPRCSYLTCRSAGEVFASFVSGRTLTTATNPADGSATTVGRACVADATPSVTDEIKRWQAYWGNYPDSVARWSAADASDPGCLPQVAAGCQAATLSDWSLCYSLWPATSGPQQLDVAYRACDERLDAFTRDRAGAEAAGRSEADYCSEGTITVLLGDCVWDPTDADRAALAARVGWYSFLEALPQGPPGEPWPPHPEVPGGDRHIVIAGSPVWPRVAAADALHVDGGPGCMWSAQWLRATVMQMLPWVPAHRAAVEAHGGFTEWLARWDRLSADQRAEAEALHVDGDLTSVACPVTAAADGTRPADQNLSYQQCRWELARPGVWHWTLDAGFTDGTRNVTETLAEDITWFRSFDAYTNQRTWWQDGRAQAAAG